MSPRSRILQILKITVRISIIVAMAENGVIGRDGGLPWRIPDDLRHFKKLTMGKPIVMGRKTYQSIGQPLPGRLNIVLSRDDAFRPQGVTVAANLEQVLASDFSGHRDVKEDELMVIGGAAVYRDALPHATRIYLTEVAGAVDGDTLFPPWRRHEWVEVNRTPVPRRGEATHDCSFVVLQRRGR